MTVDIDAVRTNLCSSLCREVEVGTRGDDLVISLPMMGRDGDHLTAYAAQVAGGWRVSDKGATMMRLSYENDLNRLLVGARERLFNAVILESGITEDEGELFLDVPGDSLVRGLFTLGQGVSRIEDLGLWTRSRIESTFYEDLRAVILDQVGAESLAVDYVVPDVAEAANYPVDYFVKTRSRPLYVFGVLNRDKARLTTIVLQHLRQSKQEFDSMVVYADVDDIPKADQKRLMNAANDSVASINDREVIRAKLAHRLAA